ncbi:MAG: hypothetical protein KDK70_30190, partial [Myxococcales bacterium]|nr:hypothetical protein [Myxococcales bacterium]
MDELARHDEVFGRLLFDRALRDQLGAGDWSALPDVAEAFGEIDLRELDALACGIRDGLLRGSLGGLGIAGAFPETLAALGGDPPRSVEQFLADTQGKGPGGVPIDGTGRGAGICVLEAFHGWAAARLAARPTAVLRAQHELATALLTALARTPRPGFVVRWSLVHAGPRGSACVLDAARALTSPESLPAEPVVYAALGGRYATGRVSSALAAVVLDAVLDGASSLPSWARAALAGIGASERDALRRAL